MKKNEKFSNILPDSITAEINAVSDSITKNLPTELWDEAANLLIDRLGKEAAKKHRHIIFNSKFRADLKAHLTRHDKNSAYIVTNQV
jgi:hypothetical protein